MLLPVLKILFCEEVLLGVCLDLKSLLLTREGGEEDDLMTVLGEENNFVSLLSMRLIKLAKRGMEVL